MRNDNQALIGKSGRSVDIRGMRVHAQTGRATRYYCVFPGLIAIFYWIDCSGCSRVQQKDHKFDERRYYTVVVRVFRIT